MQNAVRPEMKTTTCQTRCVCGWVGLVIGMGWVGLGWVLGWVVDAFGCGCVGSGIGDVLGKAGMGCEWGGFLFVDELNNAPGPSLCPVTPLVGGVGMGLVGDRGR